MKPKDGKYITFSNEFKQEKIKLIAEKKYTVRQISRLYNVSRTAVYAWIDKFSQLPKGERLVVEKESEGQKTLELMKQVSELEQFIGGQQLRISYLEKVIEYGSQKVQFDIEKKYKQR